MSSKIYVKVNNQMQPVWLSPTVGGRLITILQNFSITIRKQRGDDYDETMIVNAEAPGPGDTPTVILRDFSKVVSKSDFEGAVLHSVDDDNWSWGWKNDNKDLVFTYAVGTPFEDSLSEYKFSWYNFRTSVTPDVGKKVQISVEAYDFPDFIDGVQSTFTVELAYPAHIISLAAKNSGDSGIVKFDSDKNIYTVTMGSPFTLVWTGAADLTDEVVLRKNGTKQSGAFKINDTYDNGAVKENAAYELSVTNEYRFSHIRTLTIEKTNWKNAGAEKDIFQDDIYGDLNYNAGIFKYGKDYYAYKHPVLYKRGADEKNWSICATNNCYSNDEYSCFAAYIHGRVLYLAGCIKGARYFSFCCYDIVRNHWQIDNGNVNLPPFDETKPMRCGFAISSRFSYFYYCSDDCITVNRNEGKQGWGGGQFYFDVPDGMKLISGTVSFYINDFYTALLCEEIGSSRRFVYLYDGMDDSEKYLMKQRVSDLSRTVNVLDTDNFLYVITEKELIRYQGKVPDKGFFPPVPDGKRAWLGSDGEKLLGIFPDKNFWIYKEEDEWKKR